MTVEPAPIYEVLRDTLLDDAPVALATVIDGPHVGAQAARRARTRSRSGTLGDPELDRVVARDALGELESGLHVDAPLRRPRRGPRARRRGVHRVVRAAAADVDLRRRRLHRCARAGRQGPRLPGHRVRRPRGVRHPAPVPDGRRGRQRLARPLPREGRGVDSGRATPCACSPTTPSSTCPRSSRALAHTGRLHRCDGHRGARTRSGSSGCARRGSTTRASRG